MKFVGLGQTRLNNEPGVALDVHDARADRLDDGAGRSFRLQRVAETLQVFKFTFSLDNNALTGIEDESGHIVPLRQLINKGPESDPLNDTFD